MESLLQNNNTKPTAQAFAEPSHTQETSLVNKHLDELVRMLTRLIGDKSRAEDVAQEALIIVIQNLRRGQIDNPASIRNYVFSTARYVYFGSLRKKENQMAYLESMDELAGDVAEPDKCIENHQSTQFLQKLISTLSVERDREIVERYYLLDDEKHSICESLALSPRHFDRVISRARGRLKQSVLKGQSLELTNP